MQINLKQAEIITAIKGYISAQGINLAGKTVVVAFTAGRKESGISAEVTIEDQEGYVAPEPVAVRQPVAKESVEDANTPAVRAVPTPPDTLHFSGLAAVAAVVEPPKEDESNAPAVKTVSLFT